jgi:hypothetical protein
MSMDKFADWLQELDAAMADMDPRTLELLRTAIARAHATGNVQEAAEWLVEQLEDVEP